MRCRRECEIDVMLVFRIRLPHSTRWVFGLDQMRGARTLAGRWRPNTGRIGCLLRNVRQVCVVVRESIYEPPAKPVIYGGSLTGGCIGAPSAAGPGVLGLSTFGPLKDHFGWGRATLPPWHPGRPLTTTFELARLD